MNKKFYFIVATIVFLSIISLVISLYYPSSKAYQNSDTLVLVTSYSPTGYFLYKDQEMGFEYDFIKKFAQASNKKLKVILAEDTQIMYQKLIHGDADIISNQILVMNLPEKEITFTQPYTQSELVLVQRKKNNSATQYIDKVSDLSNKTIYLTRQSPALQIVNETNFELKHPFDIQITDSISSEEDLIRMVAKSEIDYSIVQKEIALINQVYFDNLDVSVSITAPQNIAFIVREKDKDLLQSINQFIIASKKDETIYELYDRYFKTNRLSTDGKSSSKNLSPSNISVYDFWVQKYARNINWDWRLIAALIWQESKFKPNAKSWAGATGLMQLMPATAKRFGLKTNQEIYHPELNIKTGTKYIQWLEGFWKEIKDDTERKKFIMASYNVGEGHVKDAQALARKYGYDPHQWDGHVDYFILNKSNPYYYLDPVCKYGYCRGSEPYFYVRSIVKQYEYYKTKFSSDQLAEFDLSINFPPLPESYYQPNIGVASNRSLFRSNQIFKENRIFESDSVNTNQLKPRNPERIQLKRAPQQPQLFQKNELFRKK